MSIKTQGTELYFLDGASVLKLTCPTGITGLGGARDQIETTCLDNLDDKTYESGLGNPGQVSVPFVFKPSEASQQTLFDYHDTGEVTEWLIGFSDGTTAPTVVSASLSIGTTRTSAKFDGFIADVNIDVATNEIVRGTMTIQRSGNVSWIWKA
jgi:hypothetical protein